MQSSGLTQTGTKTSARGFAVIVNECDFLDLILLHRALRRLDYRAYLADLWRRMAVARQLGRRVLIGPFLIDQHVSFADRIGAPPFGTLALRAFDDFVVQTSAHTREWRGEPMDRVISRLRAAEDLTGTSGRSPPGDAPTALAVRCHRGL